jgi:hypothetical protein
MHVPRGRARFVPVHLEYILTEIPKNPYGASVDHHFVLPGSSSRTTGPDLGLGLNYPSSRGMSYKNYSMRYMDWIRRHLRMISQTQLACYAYICPQNSSQQLTPNTYLADPMNKFVDGHE